MFEWLTGLYYVNTNCIRISIRRNWSTSSAGQSIDLVTIIIHFLRCIASRNQPAWSRHNIVDNVLFLAILSTISARNILHNIVDFLSGLCVWRIYVYFLIICYDIWRIYHKISMYFLITCWMLQVLTVLDWWFILINLLIDKLELIRINWSEIKPSVCPKSCTIIIGEFKVKKRNSVEDTFTNNFQDSTLNEIAVVNFDSRFHPIINICW